MGKPTTYADKWTALSIKAEEYKAEYEKEQEQKRQAGQAEREKTTSTTSVVEKRGETPEERATYARLMALNDFGTSNIALAQREINRPKERMKKIAANVEKLQSELQPQEHNPRKVDVNRIMRQNSMQRAAQSLRSGEAIVGNEGKKASDVIGDFGDTAAKIYDDQNIKGQKIIGFSGMFGGPLTAPSKKRPDMGYSESIDRTMFDIVDKLPKNERGEYLINGIPYKREEVWSMLRPEVEQSLSLNLLNDYEEYRDLYAHKLGYKSMDDMLSQYDARLAEIEKNIKKTAADKYPQNVNLVFPEAHMAMNMARGATAETEGLKAVRDARDQIAAMRKGDFTSGLAEGFDFGSFVTFGLSGLSSDINMLRTLNKVKDGKELSASEQNMYNIFAIQSELNSLDESMGTSFWRGVGQGVGFTAELAPQFIPGMNIASSLFKASSVAVKAGIRLSRNIARENVWKGVARGAWEVMGKPAYNLLKAQGAGLIASLPMTSTWSNYVGKRTEQFKVVNGQLEYTPTKAWKDLYDTLAESSSEISSELAGGFINDIVGGTFKQFGKRLGIEKIGSKIGLGKNADYILGFKKSDAFKAFERSLGFQGFLGEPLSEIWGDVTSNILKMAVTGNGNLEMLKDPNYWAQALAVSTIYGGSLQLFNAPERISYYNDIRVLGKKKADILSKIEDKELHDTLIKLGGDESLNVSAQKLANLAWSNYNVKDIARAMDYIRAEAILQVAMGYNEQNMHLAQFTAVARKLEESAYRGVDGKSEVGTESEMYQLITPEGKRYDIISGDVTNVTSGDDLLMAIDEEGNKTSVAKQKGNRLAKSTVAEQTRKMYVQMFSDAEMKSLVEDVENTYENLEKPTKEDVVSLMSRLAIALPEQGGKITLVDGREGYFIDMTEDGQLLVEFDTPNGVEMKSVPFYSVLSSADHIAETQKLSLAEKTVDTAKTELEAEVAADANATEPTAEATEPTTATDTPSARYAVGEIIDTPNGKGRIIAVTNGKYAIDHNLENTSTAFDVESMDYAEYSIEEIEGAESSTQPTEAEAQPAEQTQETQSTTAEADAEVTPEAVEAELDKVSDVKTIPTNKDGSVNYDAIDDAKLYAELFAKDMGSKEAAAEAVANMHNAEAESVKKIEKASKKASSANQIVANKKKLDVTKQRIAFYDDVLAELTRSEEAIPETAEVVTPTEDVQPTAEIIKPSVSKVAEIPTDTNERASLREDDGVVVEPTTPTATTPQPTKAGLVKNDLSAKLTDRLQKTLDAMAQAMGVTVTFVDREITTANGGKANAHIIGNHVEISWKHRDKAIRFLMGHEFTHRMKDLSLEAYVAFEQSVKEYLGEEEWNKRVEKLRSLYESQRVSISDELAAEEVTADFVGDMAYDEQTFDKYVDSNKENTGLLASIARIFRSIADFFRNVGDKAHTKRLDNMTKKLDALIAASSEAVANGAQSEGVRYSISEDQASAIIEAMKANAEVAPQIELTPENWATEFGAEGVVSTPIGEVKMGANQYQKMAQPDRRTKLGMVKPTLTNPDVIIEEASKPKDGRVPERNSSYVFVKAFTNADGTRDYMFTSVSNLRDGIEIVMSNQEKETPRIKRLLKEGKLAYINKATLPSEFTASAQGDQSTIPSEVSYSESKDTTSSPNMQEGGAKFSLREPIFYSNAEYAVRGIKQEKATPEQWLKMIEKNGGLKAGEDKWLGLSDWLKASDKKTLTKDEVLQYIAENDIQIEEVEYAQFGPGLIDEATRKLEAEMREIGIDAMREKYNGFDDLFEVYNNELVWSENMASESEYEDFIIDNNIVDVNAQANAINEIRSRYTTNGLTNKREIALVVPTIEPYNTHDEVHFGDAGGGRAVAWIRFGETADADGKRVLVIDEIQSKRHQDGREKGYSDKRVSQQELYDAQEEAFSKVIDYESALADKYGEDEWASLASEEEMAEYERLRAIDEAATNAYENYDKGIPSAPFEKNWAELAMKRMLRYAAENGFDYVAWTTGDQQAERYGMLRAVSKIVRRDNSLVEGKRFLLVGDTVVPHKITVSDEGIIVASTIENIEGKLLSEVMGKEIALKMMQMGNKASLESANLRIGGEGMKAFYDQMLPSFVRKYAKKWGATVGEVTMPDLEENNTMHSVDVTPAMRESVMQGQPKFSLREVNDRFNEELATLTEENARERILNVGTPSPILLACGIEDKPIRLYGAKILSKVRKHGYKIDDLKNLPLAISSPIAVFEGSKKNSFAILTELRIGNNNVLAALSVGKGGHDVDFNIISSVYDKREDSVARWVNDGKVLWVDKKKALDYFSVSAPLAEAQNNQELISTTKVIQNFENPKIEPRFSLRGSDKSLVGLHNISLDKLRKAIKMGGLANPSVAVIDVDKATHEDYGDYTLVLTSNMVDARLGRNAGTWAGDAWTPTYPQVVKRIAMSKDITRFHKDINKMPEAMRNRVRLQLDSFLEDRHADSFAYWYLFEKGVAPEMAVIPPVFPDDIVKMVSEATDGTFNMWQKSDEQKARCVDAYIAYKFDGDRAAYEADLQNRKERLQRVLNTTKSQLVVKKAAGDLAALEEFGFDYDAVSTFLREVETDNLRRGQSDVQGTIRLAENYIKDNNLEEDYQLWRDSLEGRYGVKEYIFNGYTDSGNQRWLPHTTANASKWMKKQGREGATGTFPSFGLFVATVIPRMTTLNTIRKRKGHLGRPEQEYEAFKEKWENVYFELGQKLQPDAERIEDYGWWRLIEAVSTNKPKEHIKKEYGIELADEDMQKLNDMLDAIKSNYPARYFETKFERPVELSEFIAAVVPNDIPADVEASLNDAYLNVFKYDKNVEGSRQDAVLEATDSPNVRFSLMEKPESESRNSLITPEMDASYLDAVERGDMETAQRMVLEAAKLAMPNTKVVDENSNPRVVYHGSNAQFTVFDTAKIGSTTGTADGRGFYFTTDKDYARGYVTPSGKLFGVFLNIDNPLSYDSKTITKAQLKKILKEADKVEFAQEGEHYMLSNYADYTVVGIDGAINEASNLEYGYADNDVELIGSIIGGSGSFELIMNAVQKVTGKSGMIAPKDNDTTHYIVTNPSLIKSADPVTYDDNGNVIPLSERFNPEREDIRYSLRNDDMPFFDDGGDVVIFDDLEDAPAEYISSAEGKPRITEETLSTFIEGRHHEANMRIRKETDDMKKAVKARYLDEKRKRLYGIANARTNSGKVAVILGDNAVETLSLEDQALVMIAEGDVHIVWDADKNGNKGIAGELGLSNAERKNYKSITKGATVTFEKFVHQWWESIGGYEKGIDTQDMRNALIEALSEAPTAKRAIEILRDKYDSAQREYEDAIYDIEASEERELANEEARYKQELEDIKDPAKRRAYVRHYEQSVAFFDDMSGVQRTVRELERKISRLTRDAAVAQRRYERRVEAIKERNKNYTQERLDKQFERNKAFLRKVLDERNEKLRTLAEGINEAKNAIKETLQGSKAIKYNSREVQSLITSIDAVRTAEGLKKVYSKAERIILNAGIRQARNDMQRLLNMRLPNGQMVESWVGTQVREGRLSAAVGRRIIADMWRGTNSRGVTVANFVDDDTADVMKCLRDELVLPKAKRHYEEKTDAEGNVTKVLSQDPELADPAAILKSSNDKRIAELEAKIVDGTLTLVATRTADGKRIVSERTELDARRLYDSYLNVVDYKQQIEAQNKAIEEQRELIAKQREGVESGEIDASVPKESYRTLSTMYEALNDLKKSYFDKIAEFNTKVEEVLSNGRDALKEFREAQEQHRVEVIRMGLDAIGGTRVSGSPTAWQKAKAVWRGSFHNSYWTFQTTLREIDRFAPNGEGEFYNYFMRMSNKATDEFISMQHAHLATLGTYIHSLWPELSKKTAYYAFIEIMEKANTTALPTITVYERIDKDGIGHEPVRHAMCISNAMYTIAMWNQAQYKEAMQKRGITQEVINNLEAAIAEVDDRYLEFMRLVIGEMLPGTRLEYDKVHRQLFGASMENIPNYFPAKIKREYLQEDMQVAENTLPSTVTGSIISRRASNAMPDIMQSFFAVLEGHLQNMDNWASTAPLIMDMQTLLSNAKFRDLLNAYMPGAKGGYGSLSEIFRKACAIRAGVYKSRQAVSDDILLGMTKGFATANISFRISTAIKQLSAAPMFAAYVADPRCAKIWAKYTWKGPLIRGKKMIEAAAEISPAFRERWESKTMGSEVLARKSREAQYGVDTQDIGKSKTRKVAEDSIDLLKKAATDVGMYPNVYVDAWVCATGVLTIYEYELSRMTNGKPEEATEEMKTEARYKAETFMNATQQSADSAFLSEIQAQRSLATSSVTMYMNASYALHRLRLAGFQELGKQMFSKEYREAVREKYGEGALGDARKKAIYQIIAGVLGDVNFYLMGLLSKSMWALLSGGEDDEDDNPIWDWWEILKDLALTMGLNGYVFGGSVSSYLQGYDLNVAPAINELFKDLEKVPIWKKDEDGEKSWDGVNMWAAASIIAKFGFGVDPDTILNIILGIEGIIKQEGWEAGMKLFNEPQSAINLVAGRRRKGETVQEYVDRRMRLEVIGSVPSYEEMFDEDGKFIGQGKLEKGLDWGFFKLPVGGAKDYKVRNLFKEFHERQTNAVMRHVMTPTQRADIERTNEAYAKVCAELGWKTTADPDDKGVDKTQKRYVYPQGLSAGRYKNLKKIAREISDMRKELNKFVGSDEGYAEKLQKQNELKNKLIDKYDEFK